MARKSATDVYVREVSTALREMLDNESDVVGIQVELETRGSMPTLVVRISKREPKIVKRVNGVRVKGK